MFNTPGEFYDSLKRQAKQGSIDFRGKYDMEDDEDTTAKARVHMVVLEIWKVTGYRFTYVLHHFCPRFEHNRTTSVRDNPKVAVGHRTRLWCCQDAARKKGSKQSTDPHIKNREHAGMKRFACKSHLHVSCKPKKDGDMVISVILRHSIKHIQYMDVSMPPEALDVIRDDLEWGKPATIVPKIQALFPDVTATQIHTAWTTLSQVYWRRDDQQLPSARILLQEFDANIDLFTPEGVPEGVEILAWGMKKIALPLKGKVIEIGMDATCEHYSHSRRLSFTSNTDNTNSRNLELYSIMAEHDGSGFPLSYCLLTTATAVDQHKRRDSLAAWACCLKKKYQINPTFAHVDKDMGEIGCLKGVWDCKISVCKWHFRKATKTRLAKAKLATTPYSAESAKALFRFISLDFVPPNTRTDIEDYEGGVHDSIPEATAAACSNTGTQDLETAPLRIHLPVLAKPAKNRLVIRIPAPCLDGSPEPDSPNSGDEEGERKRDRRTFCPPEYRDAILTMMDQHYCAHPLIPGHCAPNAAAIHRWAVEKMYNFCEKYDLPEVWAYLWGNWYRPERWVLWARSAHPEIPVLRTTMMLEGQ